MSETFTLALISDKAVSDGGFMVNNSNLYNIKYQVDFDALFQGKNREYSKAQVRVQLITNTFNTNTTSFAKVIGGISLTGLTATNSLGTTGLFLTTYYPTNGTMTGLTNGGAYLNISTLSFRNGTQVNTIPTGVREFNVQFSSVGGTTQIKLPGENDMPNYRMILQFELYDPIV